MLEDRGSVESASIGVPLVRGLCCVVGDRDQLVRVAGDPDQLSDQNVLRVMAGGPA
jgi:hypothetical protein